MKRRNLLKWLALGSAGLLTGIWDWRWFQPSFTSIILFTDRPGSDLDYLTKFLSPIEDLRISEYPVTNLKQDLTIISQHHVLDPLQDSVPGWLTEITKQIRQRRSPALYMVSIEPHYPRASSGQIIIESNGEIFDILSPTQSYRNIRVPGAVGKTHLAIENGQVTITRASCQHKVCQKAHWHGRVVCAPNRLIIKYPTASPDIDILLG